MLPSEAMKSIRKTVSTAGEPHQDYHRCKTLTRTEKLQSPLPPNHAIGDCDNATVFYSIATNKKYTTFSVFMDYTLKNTINFLGPAQHNARLRIALEDHKDLDIYMAKRNARNPEDFVLDDQPISFPGDLSRSTTLPGASYVDSRTYIHRGREQLYIAGLVLGHVTDQCPPAGLLSPGDFGSLSSDWLTNFAEWLESEG